MFKKSIVTFTLLGLAVWCGQMPGQEKKDKKAEQAKEVCEQFAKALFANDMKGVMKLVDVPWYEADGKNSKLITKSKDLEKELKTKSQAAAGLKAKKVSLEVLDNFTYEHVLAKFGDKIPAEDRKLLDAALKKTDRILSVRVIVDEKKGSRMLWMVGWRDGQARVVGTKDP